MGSPKPRQVADIHAVLLEMAEATPFRFDNGPFAFAGHPENPPDYLLCKDNIHPRPGRAVVVIVWCRT